MLMMMRNEVVSMNEKIEEDMKERAAHAYRLQQAEELLAALGYKRDKDGKWR